MLKNLTESKAIVWAAIITAVATICAAVIGGMFLIAIANKPSPPEPTQPIFTQINDIPSSTQQPQLPSNTIEPTNIIQPSSTPQMTFTIEPTSSVTFKEDFDDNSNGWDLNGSTTRISQGRLSITVKNLEWIWLTIPNVQVTQNFTIQAEMIQVTGHSCYTRMGFGLGQKDLNQDSFLLKGSDCSESGGHMGFYDNNAEIFTTPLGYLTMEKNQSRIVRLEAKDGIYSLFIDGKFADSGQVERYGNDIGIFVWYSVKVNPIEASFLFDNILLMNE